MVQVEMPEAQLSMGSSEASPEDSKTTVVDIGASPGAKGASLDTLAAAGSDPAFLDTSEVARSEAAFSGSALSPDDATASSAGGEAEEKGWTVVQSSRRLDKKSNGLPSRGMYHASSSKSTR